MQNLLKNTLICIQRFLRVCKFSDKKIREYIIFEGTKSFRAKIAARSTKPGVIKVVRCTSKDHGESVGTRTTSLSALVAEKIARHKTLDKNAQNGIIPIHLLFMNSSKYFIYSDSVSSKNPVIKAKFTRTSYHCVKLNRVIKRS